MSSIENSECEAIKNYYNTFKENLKSDISNETVSNKKDCYIIKKSWDTELSKNFNNYNPNTFRSKFKRNYSNQTSTFNLPNESPEFINDLKNLINCLKNEEKLILENFDLMELVAKKSSLKSRRSLLNYIAGNNKILFEYKFENEAILIENASSIVEGISKNTKKIYLIKIKLKNYRIRHKKDELYKFLLSKEKLDSLNLDSYKNANSDITLETEDIFKTENGTSSSAIKQNESSSIPIRESRFHRFGGKKEIIKEEKKQETIETKLETPRGEEKEENKTLHRFYGRQRRYQNSNLAKDKKEEVSTIQNNYNETNLNTTTESETSNRRWFRGKFYSKQSTDNISKKNEELNNTLKNDNISAIDKDKEIKKLKEELQTLKVENDKLKTTNSDLSNSNNEYIKQNKDLNKDINDLNRQKKDLERQQNDLNKKLKDKEKELEKINSNNDREIQKLKNEKKELDDKIRNNEESIKNYKTKEKNYLSKINEYEINNKKKDQEFQKKLDNLEKDNKNLSKRNEELDKEISGIKDDLDKEIKEGDELFKENNILKNNEKEFNKKIKKLEDDLQNSKKENENRISKLKKENQESISELGMKLDDKIKYNEELNKENEKLKDNEKKNLKLIKDYENNEKNYLSKIKELETNIKQKEKIINNLEKEKTDLLKINKDLEKENSEFQVKLNNEIAEGDKLYDENQDLKKKNEEFNKAIKDLEDKIQDSEKEYQKNINKLEKENNQNISNIESELDDMTKNYEKISKENEKLKDNEKKYLKQIKDYELNEKNYQLDQKDLQKKLTKSEKDLDEIKNSYSEIMAENDKLIEENNLLKSKIKEKSDSNDKLAEKKRKELNDKILFLENKEMEIENERKGIEKTKQDLEKMKQQLEQERKNINNNPNQLNINTNNNNINNLNFHTYNKNSGFKNNNINLNNNMNNINNNNNNMINNLNFSTFQPFNNNMMFNNMSNNINFNNNMINNFNNNNFQPTPQKPLKKDDSPISKYPKPPLIGLNNIGATCYLNATLQCLSQTRALTNYFLNEKNKTKIINNNIAQQNPNDLQLAPIYLELIQNLWDKNNMNRSYSPNRFMTTIEEMNPLFKKGQAGDSKDFIIFILEQIHRELKKPAKKNIEPKEALNQYDKNNAFNYFFYEFQKDLSIISDLFFGFNETTNICLNCKKNYNSKNMKNPICYNYGIFNVLIFPLEEVKNMRNRNLLGNNFMMNNSNIVNLYDCFSYNQKIDLFTGENKNYCNICRKLWDSEYSSTIFSSPNILVLILNRGKNNVFKVDLDFTETIDISQFVLTKNEPLIYNLYGVITHLGESGPNAHFVATCKSPVDNIWYRYNDAIVNPISNFQKDILNYGKPYILFYQKNN